MPIAHPSPYVQDVLDAFAGANVFRALDSAAGFRETVPTTREG